MKAVSGQLAALLATGTYEAADCYTITLNGGAVIRWTSADVSVKNGANTFAVGPQIKRSAISEKRGVEVATMQMEIAAYNDDLINGTAIIPFIKKRGLDGASVKLERAFAPDWPSLQSGATGSVIRFAGKVTSIDSIKGLTAQLTVSSWTVLLNVPMPRNLYQTRCLHTLYDTGCTLNPASFAFNGTVSGSGQTQTFNSNITAANGYYSLGRIVFTSGANNGVSRTVRQQLNASGQVTLVSPLPAALANGDTFTIYAGCDLLQGTCSGKFSNLPNFKATPNVPLPQTPLTIAGTSTTSKSGGKG